MSAMPATSASRAERQFQRRRLRVSVSVRATDGKIALGEAADVSVGGLRFRSVSELAVGDRGSAQIILPTGEKVRVPIEVVWREPGADGTSLYGIMFSNVGPSERTALTEAIYAPSAGTFDDGREVPKAIRGEAVGTEPVTPEYHAYYMRLLRRMESVHKLSASEADRILYARLHQGRPLRSILIDFKIVPPSEVNRFLSALYGVPYVDLSRTRPSPDVADTIPVGVATSQGIIPIRRTDGKLLVAMADPMDLQTLDLLQFRSRQEAGASIEINFALLEEVEKAINELYHAASIHGVDRLLQALPEGFAADSFGTAEVEDLEKLRALSDTTPIITLVDSLLRSAVEDRASDIHLEPQLDHVGVRFRLDGVLHEMRTLPISIYPAVVSRIKIMARMDITIRHAPQDGRASMRFQRKDFDLRIASMPTVFGEKMVVRLLEKSPSFKNLKDVGFSEENYKLFAPLVLRPYGMILSCGPTGSGKSTTLFACLQEINDGTTNITTIEDPVEYRVPGVNQIEISAKRGLSFASVLRSLLRQDPDVIYVGEVRDRETADLAVRAALTGHLLFSTLHTNTAVHAIARLVDIGVDPGLIAASLIGVIGQRLMRRICPRCSVEYAVPLEESLLLQEMVPDGPPKKLMRGKGCDHCHETGFFGRLPAIEVVAVNEPLRRLIARGADSVQLSEHLYAHDFKDLRADAIGRMLAGETTLQEVMRVTA